MNVCIIGLAFLTTASEIAEIKIQAGLNKSCVEAIMSRPKWTKEVHKQMTAFGLVGPGGGYKDEFLLGEYYRIYVFDMIKVTVCDWTKAEKIWLITGGKQGIRPSKMNDITTALKQIDKELLDFMQYLVKQNN